MHAGEDFFVDRAHEFGGSERHGIVCRQSALCFHKKGTSPRRLKTHESIETVACGATQEVSFGDTELPKILKRKINASHRGVLCYVAENIGHLQRVAEKFGVGFASWISATENFDADQPDRASHAPAIGAQLFIGLISGRLDVHLDPENDLLEESSVDLVPGKHLGESRRQVLFGVESDLPEVKQIALRRYGAPRLIGDVVDGAAKVVKDQGVPLAVRRKTTQCEGEVGFACARGGAKLKGMAVHRNSSEAIRPSRIWRRRCALAPAWSFSSAQRTQSPSSLAVRVASSKSCSPPRGDKAMRILGR